MGEAEDFVDYKTSNKDETSWESPETLTQKFDRKDNIDNAPEDKVTSEEIWDGEWMMPEPVGGKGVEFVRRVLDKLVSHQLGNNLDERSPNQTK